MTTNFNAVRVLPKRAKAHAHLVCVESVKGGFGDLTKADLANADFRGEAGQVMSYPQDGRMLALVGLGNQDSLTTTKLRNAGALIAKKFSHLAWIGADLQDVPQASARHLQALAEGISLGGYRFLAHKTKGKPSKLKRIDVASGSGSQSTAQEALNVGGVVARAQMLARDLINEPGGTLTAVEFANRGAEIGREGGLEVRVWDKDDIAEAGLGGLLGVNRGSTIPPRLLELTYVPTEQAQGSLTFVGKGIVFDAGGLSIKAAQPMMTMKYDMSGGAAVIAAMSALPELAPAKKVRALVPMTDNMLGGDATRPGDVLKIRNGKTIEVLNTDAEGRLILADALSLACEAKPDAIIDLATLTGACAIALGPKIAGLMGNNDEWIEAIRQASDRTDERVWQLPLPPDYVKQFESSVADMKNIGKPQGGAITAGLILKEFVDDTPWAHLDIAGPSWSDSDEDELAKGGSGFGVRLLIDLAKNFRAPNRSTSR